MFDRLYSEHNLAYRCFISILALCGAINTNIAERKEGNAEYERMQKFFSDALSTLENQKKKFLRYYLLAVKVWMDVVAPTEAEALEIRRDMSRESKRANFTGLYARICREADLNLHLGEK
ncbi:MAG TPA: hypothetical protein VEL49_08755 [Ktedonobacteraceae bacterium]|nr:hypothetical protein [Ktedonobacteraceae bacterium]